jgi:uncharacterized protein YegP (UPF0339 family)
VSKDIFEGNVPPSYPTARTLIHSSKAFIPSIKNMGKFVVTKRTNGEFQFKLNAGNGQTILTSEGYASKSGCEGGIESVRKNSKDDTQYDRKTSTNGKPYFNLKATNGQIIGTSEMYESEAGRDGGIDSVKANAAEAAVDDQTV